MERKNKICNETESDLSLFRTKAIPPDLAFHFLRHTHASILLKQGHSPKTIQIRLGHSDIETTMNFYGHLMQGMDQQAADAFGNAIENSINQTA